MWFESMEVQFGNINSVIMSKYNVLISVVKIFFPIINYSNFTFIKYNSKYYAILKYFKIYALLEYDLSLFL